MQSRSYLSYGNLTSIPTKHSELDNHSKSGSLTVDAIIIENNGEYEFVKIVSRETLIDVKAGYIANTLKMYASAMQYPFDLSFKNKNGKNVIV